MSGHRSRRYPDDPSNVYHLHGHVWEQTPYESGDTTPIDPDQEIGATIIGDNPYSYYEGARMGIGPTCHDDVVLLHGAGGSFGIPGDYMYRDFGSFHLDGGLWGILRVGPASFEEPPPAQPIE